MSLRVSICFAVGVAFAPVTGDASKAIDRAPDAKDLQFSAETVAQAFRTLSARRSLENTPCARLPGLADRLNGPLGKALIGHAFACEDFSWDAEAIGRRPAASFAAISQAPGAGDGPDRAPFARSFQRFGLPDAIVVPGVAATMAEQPSAIAVAVELAEMVPVDVAAAPRFDGVAVVSTPPLALSPSAAAPDAARPVAAHPESVRTLAADPDTPAFVEKVEAQRAADVGPPPTRSVQPHGLPEAVAVPGSAETAAAQPATSGGAIEQTETAPPEVAVATRFDDAAVASAVPPAVAPSAAAPDVTGPVATHPQLARPLAAQSRTPAMAETLAEQPSTDDEAREVAEPVPAQVAAPAQVALATRLDDVAVRSTVPSAVAPSAAAPETTRPIAADPHQSATVEKVEAPQVAEARVPVVASETEEPAPSDEEIAERRRQDIEKDAEKAAQARAAANRRAAIRAAAIRAEAIQRAAARAEAIREARLERLAEAQARRDARRASLIAAARRRAMRNVSVSRTVRDPEPRAAIRARRPVIRAAQRPAAPQPAAAARPQARSFSPKMSSAGPAQPAPRQ